MSRYRIPFFAEWYGKSNVARWCERQTPWHLLLWRLPNREGIENRGANDNHVSTDNRRRENSIQSPIHRASQAFRQIDATILAKPLYWFSRFGVKRDEIPISRTKEDALSSTVLPIVDTAIHETCIGGSAIFVGFRVHKPRWFLPWQP